ncbi:hypothetical protein AAMO2058_001632400 [Amorphochlora amoebiformis]
MTPRRGRCPPGGMSPVYALLIIVVVSSAPLEDLGEADVWFEASPSDQDTIVQRDEGLDGVIGNVFGRSHLDSDPLPPNGYTFRILDEDELDCEQGAVKAYVPFESLVYSVPSFTLDLEEERMRRQRAYAPKQVWLTAPKFDKNMYRLSASADFIIWADDTGYVTELYEEVPHGPLLRRPHHNSSVAGPTRMISVVVTSSSRYRVVGVDDQGRFLARCLRAKVSIDCTALGSNGADSESYFWLDLGSAMPSYRFKGVAVQSEDGKRFFLLTTSGHLVCMETRILVVSADGKLWQLDLDVEEGVRQWTCHGYPEEAGPLALMEAIAVKEKGEGSLFLVSKSGKLVEWRRATPTFVGVWVVHSAPLGYPKIVSAPVAFSNYGILHLFMVGENGYLLEFQIGFFRSQMATGWDSHQGKVPLAQKRGAMSRNSLWFLQSDGNLIERRIIQSIATSPNWTRRLYPKKRSKKRKSRKEASRSSSSSLSSEDERWEIFIYDKLGNLVEGSSQDDTEEVNIDYDDFNVNENEGSNRN